MSATEGPPEAETPDAFGAYPRLSEQQIDAFAQGGDRRAVEAGDALFREGDPATELFVILEGVVAIVAGGGGDERVIGLHGPGRFLGELNLFTGQAWFVSGVAREAGEVLAVPVDRVRDLVSRDQSLGDLILKACLIRRSILLGLGAGLKIIGSRHSADTRRLRDFAARNRIPHTWIDLERDAHAELLVQQLGVSPDETPVVVWGDREVLRNPSTAELARLVGLRAPAGGEPLCDLVVVGAGPAGLAASVYGASEGLATIALDAVATGGQAGASSRIENYLGFPAGISGGDLADRALIQARRFGARISVPAEATALEERDGHYVVRLGDGEEIETRTVVIATGARYRRLEVPRLEEFEKTSVYYAATPMEAQVCKGDPIAVVGGGNSAGQATVFLSQFTDTLRLIVRESELTANMSRYLADRIERSPVDVLLGTEVRELIGEDSLEALLVEENETGERRRIEARALFVFIGAEPHAGWLGEAVALDDRGFVVTGQTARPHGSLLETSSPGVFAAGDVRSGSVKRMASAVGEGSMSVRLAYEHLQGHDGYREQRGSGPS